MTCPEIPRWGVSRVIYGLTEKGRAEYFDALPRAG